MLKRDGSSVIGSIRSRFGKMADPLSDEFSLWVPIACVLGVAVAMSVQADHGTTVGHPVPDGLAG